MSKVTNSKILYKKLVDSIFEREVHLVIGPAAEARDFIERKLRVTESPGDDSDGESITTDDGTFIIWLKNHDGSPHWDGVLAHEITHTVFTVLNYVGVPYAEASEEVYTHYSGSMMRQAKQFLKRQK